MNIDIDFSSIQEAVNRLNGIAHHTPVMTSRTLNRLTGQEVFIKCENFQCGGSFKFRGAFNAIHQLSNDEKQKGIVAFSSGNHAQAVALAAQKMEIKAIVCMPTDSPSIKKYAVKSYGGEVVLYDRMIEDREAIAQRISEENGMTVIPPFDDPRIITGAGTVAFDFLREVKKLDAIVVPVGGGGLISGTSIAVHGLDSRIKVIGVEPSGAHDTYLSLEAGKRISIESPNTIADGLRATIPGKMTFPIIMKHVESIVTVTDDEIIKAIRFAFTRLKIVIEPSGATSLAALLFKRISPRYKRIGVIISGGNVDPLILRSLFNWHHIHYWK